MDNNFVSKAQEISYALMRVAVYIKRKDMRLRVENLAMEIIENVARDYHEDSIESLNAVAGILKLAVSIYEVETLNAKMIIEQSQALEIAIRQSNNLCEMPNIGNIFSKPIESGIRQSSIRQLLDNAVNEVLPGSSLTASGFSKKQEAAIGQADSTEESDVSVAVQENVGMISIASTIRQTAILNRVRMMTVRNDDGSLLGCRMKDLMAAFPDVSERTIRNDLQRLLAQNKVDRIGSGGPASFYVIKQGE